MTEETILDHSGKNDDIKILQAQYVERPFLDREVTKVVEKCYGQYGISAV